MRDLLSELAGAFIPLLRLCLVYDVVMRAVGCWQVRANGCLS